MSTATVSEFGKAFDAKAEPLGLTTLAAKAAFVDLSPSTFHHVYYGNRGAGRRVIRKVLNAPWPEPVTYEDFFRDAA